jgi:transposase-like protein
MLKIKESEFEKYENRYPGIMQEIMAFEKMSIPQCPNCQSDNTAKVLGGIIGRVIHIAAATTKAKLNPSKPGPYYCNHCQTYFKADT